jgi:DNA (cytosine-5)-methyltransferase 1
MLQVDELKRAMGLVRLRDEHGTAVTYKLEQGSRRDRIKLLGNGVCAPVMRAVAGSLLGADAGELVESE